MKTTTLIISIVISLVIGGSIGYFSGKSTNDNGDQTKKLQDSVTMMKEQSSSIQKMAEMMKSSGLVMQEVGIKYKDDEAISEGKDLQMIGEKYMGANTKATENSGTMKNLMGN
ncbi:MAG: hypothetical protein AAB444_00940 [Patescibacteria group bacterium]